jgi:hypothetical protein
MKLNFYTPATIESKMWYTCNSCKSNK